MSRRQLMRKFAVLSHRLHKQHGIRDVSDYAEVLVAEAVEGKRVKSRVTKGHDVIAPQWGRIEVKCRRLPVDGRREERVQVNDSKLAGFEFLAVVIFQPNLDVKGAVIVPYTVVWEYLQQQPYNRVSYSKACQLSGAKVITETVRAKASC